MKKETLAPDDQERRGDCQHLVHDPGQCANCNCGQSEIVHGRPGYEQTVPDARQGGNTRGMGGRRAWCPSSE